MSEDSLRREVGMCLLIFCWTEHCHSQSCQSAHDTEHDPNLDALVSETPKQRQGANTDDGGKDSKDQVRTRPLKKRSLRHFSRPNVSASRPAKRSPL
jgi:hypothetical protein